MANGDAGDVYLRSHEERRRNRLAYRDALRSNKYDKDKSYFSEEGGCYVLFMRGHNHSDDEMTVAKAFADKGHNIELQPENNYIWASKWKGGMAKYAEGTLDGHLYEQMTPSAAKVNAVRKTLNHAVDKNAKIAVLYDKHNSLHREDIENGIAAFKSYPHNSGRVTDLYLVSADLEIYRHKL